MTARALRVAVLTTHEGSASWRGLLASIEAGGGMTMRPFSGFTDVEYRNSRSPLARIRLRLQTYLFHPLWVVRQRGMFARDFDTIICNTDPFFLPAIVTVAVKGPRIVVLQSDIFPEAFISKNLIKRGGLIDWLLTRIVAGGLRRAAAVIYVAEEHRQLMDRLIGGLPGDVVIPTPSVLSPPPDGSVRNESSAHAIALYAGTLGMMHDTSTILAFVSERQVPPGIVIRFRTSGAGKATFERAIADRFPLLIEQGIIEIGNALPDAEWKTMMYFAEIGLVFQNIGAGDVVFPSKAASILAAGQAMLAIADRDSTLGVVIDSTDCGWLVPPGDLDALHCALEESANPAIVARKRANALRVGKERFAVEVVAKQWHQVLAGPGQPA